MVNFIWGVADLIRDTFKRGKYQDVILPLTVLRRLDCVLAPTKTQVLSKLADPKIKQLADPYHQLCKASGFAFYNTSLYNFEKLLDDAPNLSDNLRNYIAGFSDNMREVIEKFDFNNTIAKLDEAGLLYRVVERFKNVNLHPDMVTNPMMGTIFEELLRKFNEALNENPGEHFTPRDVVHLMASLLLLGEEERLKPTGIAVTVYDPCCGSGGMLTITKEHITGDGKPGINSHADVYLYGQEVNPETFAICKSDLFMKDPSGRDADNIVFGSTLSDDRQVGKHFDYIIANPPYGKDWKRDEDAVKTESLRGDSGRFGAGLPRISDGQLLFLQHMLFHKKPENEGGSRIAIIMNGSPLFTGDAGSGESEIRRWILENDWLEALIAMPEQLFYNTGIATYIWVLTNRKSASHRGKVMLIDATSFWTPMRKSLGDKRREIPNNLAAEIFKLLTDYQENEHCRIYPTTHFGYRKITVERPLRLNFQTSPERIAHLNNESGFINLAVSKKKDPKENIAEIAQGQRLQEQIRSMLGGIQPALIKNRVQFEQMLLSAAKSTELKLSAPLIKAILSACSERDETAEICYNADGSTESDPELRDTENVPLDEDIHTFFEREVKPHVPDAWINVNYRDEKDGQIGKVGYEINFNRYFYQYQPPRPLEEIEADIKTLEKEILEMLREVTD
ncbi:MAG: class I SAM-dependent DNA methyltransferase [archaeon]